jgi:hypothetical protein
MRAKVLCRVTWPEKDDDLPPKKSVEHRDRYRSRGNGGALVSCFLLVKDGNQTLAIASSRLHFKLLVVLCRWRHTMEMSAIGR